MSFFVERNGVTDGVIVFNVVGTPRLLGLCQVRVDEEVTDLFPPLRLELEKTVEILGEDGDVIGSITLRESKST